MPPVQVENEYSVPDPTTYDVPRSAETAIIESAQVEPEKEVKLIPSNIIHMRSIALTSQNIFLDCPNRNGCYISNC